MNVRRPLQPRLVAMTVTLLAIATLIGFSSVEPAAAARAGDDAPRITLASQTLWVGPNSTVVTALTLDDIPPDTTLQPVLYRSVPTRSAFKLTLDGRALSGSGTLLTEKQLPDKPTRATVRFRVTDGTTPPDDTASGDDVVTLAGPGVYPLVIELHDADGATLTSLVTYIVRLAPQSTNGTDPSHKPLNVATLLTARTAPSRVVDGDISATANTEAQLGALSEGLSDLDDGPPIATSISPDALDALAHGTSDQRRLLDDLANRTDTATVLSSPYVDVDIGGWLRTPSLAPLIVDWVTRGRQVVTDTLHEPSGLADLSSYSGPPGDPASPAALRWLAEHGTTTVIVRGSDLEALDTTAFPRTLAQPFRLYVPGGGSVLAAQIDEGLSAHFTGDDPALAVNHLMADLAVISLDLPGVTRGVVVAPPTDWTPSSEFITEYRRALESADADGATPLMTATSLDGLFGTVATSRASGDLATQGPPLIRALRPTPNPTELTALGTTLVQTKAKVAALASMQPGGKTASTTTIDAMNRQVAVAASSRIGADRQASRLAKVSAEVDRLVATVKVPRSQTITLTSQTSEVPLTIRRSEDGPTLVQLHLDAGERIDFENGDTQLIHLDETVTRVQVKLHVDSPGDSVVIARVTSPDGTLLAGQTRLLVRSTAVSGMGVIITFGSLAFLLVWWGRDIVRGRRRRRAARPRPADLIDIDSSVED